MTTPRRRARSDKAPEPEATRAQNNIKSDADTPTRDPLLVSVANALPRPLRRPALYAANLLTNRAYFGHLATILLIWESILCTLIIWKVPYTEIDWVAYMQEVSGFLNGERDYTKLRGDTGPLVYPAGFVYLYSGLYWVTGGGENLVVGQGVFAGLYVATLAIVMKCLERSKLFPNYALILLTLSKRLHSIYVLRLFNDPWAMAFVYLAIYAMIEGRWRFSAISYSLAVSIKMNALLFAPAFAFLHLLATGFSESVVNGLSFLLIQILLSLPFTLHDPHAYLSRSFELTRTFLYKWSTNWKFLSEETFLSSAFSRTLLLLHLVLLLFLALRWLNGMSPRELIARRRQPSADLILSTMFTCNLAGILCARSLHYQFFSWYAWTVPYLMSFADLEGAFRGLLGNRILAEFLANALRIAAFGLLEMTWLVFPATWWSSLVMGGVNGGLLLACLFFGRWQRPLGM